MKLRNWVTGAVVALAGCGQVVEESYGTIVVDGQNYDLRNRVIDGPNGSYKQTSVIVGNVPHTCLPDSPGDCRAAVKQAKNDIDRR